MKYKIYIYMYIKVYYKDLFICLFIFLFILAGENCENSANGVSGRNLMYEN